MNRDEFALFAAALRTYFPKENIMPNKPAMELWFEQIKDIDYETAEILLRTWVATNKWSPTIADIREMLVSVSDDAEDDWAQGWENVRKAIGRFGMYREAEALESFKDVTKQTVKRLGWKNICSAPMDDNSIRANFRMIYEQTQNKQKESKQIPIQVRVAIDELKKQQLENKLHKQLEAGYGR